MLFYGHNKLCGAMIVGFQFYFIRFEYCNKVLNIKKRGKRPFPFNHLIVDAPETTRSPKFS